MSAKTLVVYFSAEGNTAAVAKIIADTLNADIRQIEPRVPYTAADLDWTDRGSRSSREMADEGCRPELAGDIDIGAYDTIILGFPIWWYVEPRIVDSFAEGCNWQNKTVVPFATSGGSGIGRACARLKQICQGAQLKEGKLLNARTAAAWARSL